VLGRSAAGRSWPHGAIERRWGWLRQRHPDRWRRRCCRAQPGRVDDSAPLPFLEAGARLGRPGAQRGSPRTAAGALATPSSRRVGFDPRASTATPAPSPPPPPTRPIPPVDSPPGPQILRPAFFGRCIAPGDKSPWKSTIRQQVLMLPRKCRVDQRSECDRARSRRAQVKAAGRAGQHEDVVDEP